MPGFAGERTPKRSAWQSRIRIREIPGPLLVDVGEQRPARSSSGCRAAPVAAARMINGNTLGYSFDRKFAINPVAKYLLKAVWHELGHTMLGHSK
jgi:hypothetical protein